MFLQASWGDGPCTGFARGSGTPGGEVGLAETAKREMRTEQWQHVIQTGTVRTGRQPCRLLMPQRPIATAAHRPANENDPGTAMMLARLRRPPSYAVYYGAFALSLVWMFGWMLINSNAIFFPPDNQAPPRPTPCAPLRC